MNDEALVRDLSRLLRGGLLLVAVVLLTGGGIYLVRHGAETPPDRHHFDVKEQAREYRRPRAMFHAALEGRGRALVQVALLILIAIPIVRVAYSILVFARRRDLIYTVIPLIVLIVMILGFFAPPH